MTNHIWDGFWFIGNGRAFNGLPPDLKKIVSDAINNAGMKQRADIKTLNENVVAGLKSKGMVFTQPAGDSFRGKLRDSGFYADWKGRFGDQAWGLLEDAVGKLA
jgi:TRAP-type C4-dicarboxylate transport system substrate-binding protein